MTRVWLPLVALAVCVAITWSPCASASLVVELENGEPLHGFHPETPAATMHKQDRVRRDKVQTFARTMLPQRFRGENYKEHSSESGPYDHNFHASEHSVFPKVPHRQAAGGHVVQPFPDTLRLTIRLPSADEDADDLDTNSSEFHSKLYENVELKIMRDIYDWNAKPTDKDHRRVSIRNGDHQEIATMPHLLTSYKGFFSTDEFSGWLVMTLHADGRFQLTLNENGGDTFQIDLVEHHYRDIEEPTDFDALHATSFQKVRMLDAKRPGAHIMGGGHGMTVFAHRDLKMKFGKDYKCGNDHHDHDHHDHNEADHKADAKQKPAFDPMDLDLTGMRLQADSSGTPASEMSPVRRSLLTVAMWTDCYPNQALSQRFSIGIVADTGYYNAYNSDATQVQTTIAQLFSLANLVYTAQINIILTMTDLIMYSSLASTPLNSAPAGYTGFNFNEAPPCANDINSKLSGMATWKQSVESERNAVFHLLTNCYPSGLIGVSYIGAICNTWSVGVSSIVPNHWQYFAHELGHNFGAQHTFGLGGIMDYSDGRYPTGTGDYMFAPPNQAQMCGYIAGRMAGGAWATPYCYQAVPAGPVCGNGIVEGTEVCDDSSSCCNQATCTLNAGKQCSVESECCTGSTCAWKVSSTSCTSVTGGYCANGACKASVCNGVGNTLSFCSVPTATSCKQSCKNTATGSACLTTWSTPSVNVADGTVCLLSPLSTCASGVCKSTVAVTWSWVAGSYGTCQCDGTQTRTVVCTGSNGSTGTSSQCTATAPATTATCTAPTSCNIGTFQWMVSSWSTCTKTCGTGLQTTTSTCFNVPSNGGTPISVASSLCSGTAPMTIQVCNTQSCTSTTTYAWSSGDWGSCSKSCASGTQTRSVICQATTSGTVSTVANSYCTASSMPVSSQTCATQACTTYSLSYGTWSTCSATCGSTGTQTRSVYCVPSSAPTTTVATSYCGCGTGTTTAVCAGTTQACNTGVTCPSYAWSIGAWASCSVASCGGGTQSRTVSCIISGTRTVVADYNCASAKASTTQNCNTSPCATYAWTSGSFGACTATCGGGSQTRTVACQQTQGTAVTTVANSLCTTSSMPTSQQSCNTQACVAATYYWYTSDWTSCTKSCGIGLQSRTVYCAQTGSLTKLDSTLCKSVGTAPTTLAICNTQSCKSTLVAAEELKATTAVAATTTYVWSTSSWTNCSQICGDGGLRQRVVQCINSADQSVVSSSLCQSSSKPRSTSTCSNQACPAFWYTSEWTTCSASCQGGVQTRDVECRLTAHTSTVLADSACPGTKPASSSSCNIGTCPSWLMSDWSACSVTCGDGTQDRTATCVDGNGVVQADIVCAWVAMPASTQACSPTPCGYWQYEADSTWSSCSKQCGGGGNQTRAVTCMLAEGASPTIDADGNPTDACADTPDPLFDGATVVTNEKPPEVQECGFDACPDYYWDIRDYSACSKSCSGGTSTGTAMCIHSSNDTQVAKSMCLGAAPSKSQLSQVCNTTPCPAYQYFVASEWSTCDAECGEGYQTRQILCINAASGISSTSAVDFALCSSATAPSSNRTCTVSDSVCYGLTPVGDASFSANGRCADSKCVCRSGYEFGNCTGAPTVSDMRTSVDPANSTIATAVLAYHDTIELRWESSGSLDTVSILLSTTGSAVPLSQYIAADVPNTGRFLWTIGTNFIPTPLDGSATTDVSYRFVVYYSPSISAATSFVFRFADPCAYRNCGMHGLCHVGIAPSDLVQATTSPAVLTLANRPGSLPSYCECLNGFTGQQCEVGPCTALSCSTTNSACNDETAFFPQVSVADATSMVQPTLLAVDSQFTDLCNCTHGYGGNQCLTPTSCTAYCHNGGDRTGVMTRVNETTGATIVDSCGACSCRNLWSGADCTTCSLSCANGGEPSADCKTCSCGGLSSGYFGSHCECRFYTLTMHLQVAGMNATTMSSEWFGTDSAATTRNGILQATLRSDLLIAAQQLTGQDDTGGSGSIMLDVMTLTQVSNCTDAATTSGCLTNVIEAVVTFSLECPDTSAFIMSASARALLAASSTPTLLSAYESFSALFSDLDSTIYRGVFTSQLDRFMTILSVTDPTGLDSPTAPSQPVDAFLVSRVSPAPDVPSSSTTTSSSSSGLSTRALIGLIIGCIAGGCCLLILVSFLIFHHRRSRKEAKERQARLEKMNQRNGSPNPVLADMNMHQLSPSMGHLELPPAYTGPGVRYLNPYALSANPVHHAGEVPSFSVSANTLSHVLAQSRDPNELAPSLMQSPKPADMPCERA